MTLQIMSGDCIELMRTLPDNSVDSIVTDPPYGLGFMGKAWDALPPGLEWAEECLRVLKPGGHLLAFGGSRTWHRLAVAVEDAGFELRDSIAWLYGSGFPKSADVSKAIDKARTQDVEPTRVICRAIRSAMEARGLKSRDLTRYFDDCHPRLIDHWAARDTDSQPALPKWDQWEILRGLLDLGTSYDTEVWRLNGRKGTPGEERPDRVVSEPGKNEVYQPSRHVSHSGTPVRGAAQQWAGWGTALKPAFEPVVMGRKPLKGTVAANVLAHGTGALNIDASRIPATDKAKFPEGVISDTEKVFGGGQGMHGTRPRGGDKNPDGRFPANVILDEHTAALLDEQSGVSKSSKPSAGVAYGAYEDTGGNKVLGRGLSSATPNRPPIGDSGGASRFFYCAKAPKSERPVVDGVAHPTVKPLALMRYLITLVTPPGGVVLEPFAGSGATVEAALMDGFGIIAMERDETYLPLIQARIDRWLAAQMEDLI